MPRLFGSLIELPVEAGLVRAGLAECTRLCTPLVMVLGEPAYYGRFEFVRADGFGMSIEYGAGPEFMVLGTPTPGLVRHAQEYAIFAP